MTLRVRYRVAESLVLADQAGQVETDLHGDVRGAGEVEGHVVRDPAPQLAVQSEVEGCHHAYAALRARSTEKRHIHDRHRPHSEEREGNGPYARPC
jgi:hypothetical protein